VARRTGADTIEELQVHRDFGLRCRLCHPYVRRMLRTGETKFDQIITESESFMGRILYIFPHPDDESFGPAPVMARHRREGHEVFLLTLTRGEATSQRDRLGISKEEMADVRYREMQSVARILDLTDMTVLDLPDGELEQLDPLGLEKIVREKIDEVRPDVVATYMTHGVSGHPDHLVTHAVVKHVYSEIRRAGATYARRLALFTLSDENQEGRPSHLRGTPNEEIDCIASFTEADLERGKSALAAYETYREVIDEHKPLETVSKGVCFVFFGERFQPPLDDLFADLRSF